MYVKEVAYNKKVVCIIIEGILISCIFPETGGVSIVTGTVPVDEQVPIRDAQGNLVGGLFKNYGFRARSLHGVHAHSTL